MADRDPRRCPTCGRLRPATGPHWRHFVGAVLAGRARRVAPGAYLLLQPRRGKGAA